jgi:hypothetical protein
MHSVGSFPYQQYEEKTWRTRWVPVMHSWNFELDKSSVARIELRQYSEFESGDLSLK